METEGLTEEEIARNEQIAILTDRVERAARNEKDVATEAMDVYPILPLTSRMHFCAPPDERTLFAGFEDTLVAWTREMVFRTNRDSTATARNPVYINTIDVLMMTCMNIRMSRAQHDFLDLVIMNPEKDVLAYWHNKTPIAPTIDLLARRTANALVITRHPRQDSQQHFSYEDLANPGSRLFSFVRDMVINVHGPIEEEEAPVCAVYLVDYRPVDVLTVRLKFPRTRIVGITTPEPTDDAQMLKMLKALNAVSMSGKRSPSKEETK